MESASVFSVFGGHGVMRVTEESQHGQVGQRPCAEGWGEGWRGVVGYFFFFFLSFPPTSPSGGTYTPFAQSPSWTNSPLSVGNPVKTNLPLP